MKLINLPNIITCCNLLCGCMAIFYGLQGEVGYAALFIIAGAVFDFFDGMTARALGISGPIGKEIDSLADAVSFGIAPAILAYQIARYVYGPGEANAIDFALAMIMAAFSALRLAKFNCDERQTLSFIGLPTPSNALFWIGLTFVCRLDGVHAWLTSLHPEVFGILWLAVILCMSFLLISEIPMFSLKLKKGHNGFAENKARYIFLGLTAVILIVSSILGLEYFAASPALIILLYILLSITVRNS